MAPDAAVTRMVTATIAPHRAIVERTRATREVTEVHDAPFAADGVHQREDEPSRGSVHDEGAEANPAKTALALVSGGVGGSRRANAVAWPALHVPNAAAARVGAQRAGASPRARVGVRSPSASVEERHVKLVGTLCLCHLVIWARGPAFVALGGRHAIVRGARSRRQASRGGLPRARSTADRTPWRRPSATCVRDRLGADPFHRPRPRI